MSDLSLTKTEFKALASDSRTTMLKALLERNCTLSELATRLDMKAPTIKEHANILIGSGLIQLKDEGRKWKYYSLTRKGRDILEAKQRQSNILIILSACGVVLAGILLMLAFNQINFSTQMGSTLDIAKKAPEILPAHPAVADKSTSGTASSGGRSLPAIDNQDNAVSGTAAKGRCLPAFIEDGLTSNMTEDQKIAAEQCYSAYNEKDCISLDSYSEATASFGEADGKPDCKWEAEFSK